MADEGFDALVLAGGAARRLGGIDKGCLEIDGLSLLDRVLHACAAARDTVCVGPVRPTRRRVRWTREDPPMGGPAAAVAAGLHLLEGDYALVLAVDLPFLDEATVHSLWTNARDGDGAVLVDAEGREQWLAACYRRSELTARLARLAEDRGGLAGLGFRQALTGMDLVRVADPDGRSADCDTWEDVRHVRRLVAEGGAERGHAAHDAEH